MTRQELHKAGYTVTAEKNGADYPNSALEIGIGWQYILRAEGQPDRGFSKHDMAWAFAERLASQII